MNIKKKKNEIKRRQTALRTLGARAGVRSVRENATGVRCEMIVYLWPCGSIIPGPPFMYAKGAIFIVQQERKDTSRVRVKILNSGDNDNMRWENTRVVEGVVRRRLSVA